MRGGSDFDSLKEAKCVVIEDGLTDEILNVPGVLRKYGGDPVQLDGRPTSRNDLRLRVRSCVGECAI